MDRPGRVVADGETHLFEPQVISTAEMFAPALVKRLDGPPHTSNDPVISPAMQPMSQDIIIWLREVSENNETHFLQRKRHLNQTSPHPRRPPNPSLNLNSRSMDKTQAITRLLKHSIVTGEAEIPRRRRRRCCRGARGRSEPLPLGCPWLGDGVDACFFPLPAPRAGGLVVIARNFACATRVAGLRASIKTTKQGRILHFKPKC
ncbi:hypothetical protein NW767_15846 [Fusarium falciforme]|nr:hypothetical protein NW767_15846 [Fusarium falciforme]